MKTVVVRKSVGCNGRPGSSPGDGNTPCFLMGYALCILCDGNGVKAQRSPSPILCGGAGAWASFLPVQSVWKNPWFLTRVGGMAYSIHLEVWGLCHVMGLMPGCFCRNQSFGRPKYLDSRERPAISGAVASFAVSQQ